MKLGPATRRSAEPLLRRCAPLVAQVGAALLAAAVFLFVQIPLAADSIAHATPPPPPTELTQLRTASAQVFDNHDGTYTTSAYSGRIHYSDEEGNFRPISSALVPSQEPGYAFENEANSFRAFFKSQLEGDYLRLAPEARSFRLSLAGAAQSQAQPRQRGISYPSVFPGVELRYDLQPDGIKESLLLADAQVPLSYHFVLSPPAGAHVHAVERNDGSWAFFMAPHARSVFILEAPWAAESGLLFPSVHHASLDVTRSGGDFHVDLGLDASWLQDPLRQFPVHVDPSITIQPPFQDASFNFNCTTCTGVTADRLSIGTTSGVGFQKWRSALQFSLADIPPGASISSAKLKLYFDGTCLTVTGPACGGSSHQIEARRMLGSWSPSSKVSQLSVENTNIASFTLPSGAPAQWMSWDITSTAVGWYGGTPNFGLLLKRATETTGLSGPRPPSRNYAPEPTLGPKLEVTYNGDGGQLLEPETVHSNGAELHWIPYGGPGAPPFSSYEVHRSTNPSFAPSTLTQLTKILDAGVTSYRDTTAKAGATFTYKVAVNGYETNRQTVTMPADGQARKALRPDPAAGSDTYLTYRTDLVHCTNRGGLDRAKVGTDVNSVFRPLVRFDVSDLPTDATITSATLSLWHPETTSAALTVNAHRLTSPWQEGSGKDTCTGDGTTWYELDGGVKWGQDGGDFDPSVAASLAVPSGQAASWHAYVLTVLVQGWVRGDYANDGVLLRASDETIVGGKYLDYYASDFGVAPTLRPKLTITYAENTHPFSPVVSVTKPAPSEQLSGSAVTIAATAVDDRRVDSVEFFVDGNSIGTDTSDPFSVTWNSTGVANGIHSFSARAVDDAGNQTTSAAVSATVGNSSLPTTTITSPASGATVTGTVSVTANASDDLGVTKVDLLVDNLLVAAKTTAPYTFSWNTLDPALPAYEGQHTLTTKAYDAQGQVATSAAVTVTVANATGTKYLAALTATGIPGRFVYDSSAPSQQQYPVNVTVTNRSAVTWAVGEIVLRYRWLSGDGTTTDSGSFSLGTSAILPNGSVNVQATVEPVALPSGTARAGYTLRFDLYETATTTWFAARGNKPLERQVLIGERVQEPMLGLEPYYQYVREDLGLGVQNLVNVATGNSIVRWRPLHEPGIGLSTDIELTYNSREGNCNHRFCPAGAGWSLGVSGLTRVGDLAFRPWSDANGQYVDLIEADGTLQHFTWNGIRWVSPAGVHLYLRDVRNSRPPDEPNADWAVTRPDRTTYYYDEVAADPEEGGVEGLLISIRDKNRNRLRIDLATGNIRHLPLHVVDQGGRSVDFDYYGPGIHLGRLKTITDHTLHKFEFCFGASPQQFQLQTVVIWGSSSGASCSVGQAPSCAAPNRCLQFSYDGQGDHATLLSVKDPLTVRDPVNRRATTFTYTNGKLASRTPRAGDPTTFCYTTACGANANETKMSAPLGRTTIYTAGADGLVTKIVDPLGRRTDQTWTARHLHEVIDYPTQRKVEYLYNANGLLTDEYDQLRNCIHHEYLNLPADSNDSANSISLLQWRTDASNPCPGPNRWTYTYDASNINLVRVTDPTAAWTEHTYYADGTLHTVEGPNHHVDHLQTVYEDYDLNGFARRITDEKGQVAKSFYDDDGLRLWSQDANHPDGPYLDDRWYRTKFEYDSFRQLVRQSEPKSTHLQTGTLIWTETQYDANGDIVGEREPAYQPATGVLTTTQYDKMDRQTCVVGPKQKQITTFEYDAAGRLTRTTQPNGIATPDPPLSSCPLDPRSRGDDYVMENVYDALDRVVTERRYNENGVVMRKMHYCYDGVGDLRWVTAPKAGLPDARSDCPAGTWPNCPAGSPPSYTTRYCYDEAHRLRTETDPLDTAGNRTRTRRTDYDANDNVIDEFDENGTNTHYTYTARGDVEMTEQTYSTIPLRKLTSKTVYDPAGNVVCEVSPRAWDFGSRCTPGSEGFYTTHYDYDAIGQVEKISLRTDAQQPSRSYVHRRYDGNGNMTLTTLPDYSSTLEDVSLNKQTKVDYFDPGWIASSEDHVNPIVRYDYEPQGWQNLRETEHRWGRTMRWFYSAAGEMTQLVDRQGVGSKFGYDYDGNEISAARLRAGEPGEPTRFDIQSFYNGFDEQTRVRQLLSSDNWRFTKYGYNDNGELTSREDDGRERDNGTELQAGRLHDFVYDEAGQLTRHRDLGTDRIPSLGDDQIDLTYDPPGWEGTRTLSRLNGTGTPQPKIWSGRTYFLSGDLASVATRKVNSSGPLLEQHTLNYVQNGIYVSGNRVSDAFQLMGPSGQGQCRTQSCTTSYNYGPRENLVRETRSWQTNPTDYTHDSAMNVIDEYAGATHTRHYDYDGNRLTHFQDFVGPISQRYYRYEDGNLRCVTDSSSSSCPAAPLNQPLPAGVLEDYRWNGRDRLSCFRRTGQQTCNASYAYDPLDRPVTQTDARGQTSYSYLGTSDNVSSETLTPTGSPPSTKSYSYGPEDERVGMTDPSGDYYFARNVHTDVSLLLYASTGDAAASYLYKPYGGRDALSTGDPEDTQMINPYRFNDKHFDPGSSTLDMGVRRYNNDIGRFLGQDTLTGSGENLDLANEAPLQNRYAFAAANPIVFIETDGHAALDPCTDPHPCQRRPSRCRTSYPKVVFPIPCPLSRKFVRTKVGKVDIHPTVGLESYAGADFKAPHGAPVVAIESGIIRSVEEPRCPQPYGSAGCGVVDPHGAHGWKLYLHAKSGRDYFYTHLGRRTASISRANERVRAGQLIGTIINFHPWNIDHTHIGVCAQTKDDCYRDQTSLTIFRRNIVNVWRMVLAPQTRVRSP
jgi:RHS repeat-associated protein